MPRDPLRENETPLPGEQRGKHDADENDERGAGREPDELLPGEISVAELVWRLIADGGSHIAAHHRWVVASQGGMWLKPSMTLGRPALVCASRAMYVMTGESPVERRGPAQPLPNDEEEGRDRDEGGKRGQRRGCVARNGRSRAGVRYCRCTADRTNHSHELQ